MAAKLARRIPWGIRSTALAGLLLTGVYAALYVGVRSVDPATASGMLRMYGLTIAAGRETAMFDALARGMHPGLVYGLSVLDDFGSFLLALPFAWLVVRSLKRVSRVRWALAHFEKQALQRRHWVHRWGLGGLALVYFLPGFGAGVPITVLLSVLARIPFGRVVPFFAVATLVVDGLWALILTNALGILPDAAWVEALPLAVVGLVLLSAAIGAWRGRAERHVALLDWSVSPTDGEAARLEACGIRVIDGLVRVDVDALAQHLGGKERRKGRLLGIGELLLLGMTAEQALTLAQSGIHGIEDVAGTQPQALATVAGDTATPTAAVTWIIKADALVARQHRPWTT
ncbi:MAG: small multi-drug export protein [Candidatus Thermoplasmatota archaeon]